MNTDEKMRLAAQRFFTPQAAAPSRLDEELLRDGTAVQLDCDLVATAWGGGPIVLLAHGWEGRRTQWRAFVPSLVTAGFRVVAIDAPAHGDSPGERTNVIAYANVLVGVGRKLGPLVSVVGHSWGAAAAVIALRKGLRSSSAVLISCPATFAGIATRWARQYGLEESSLPEFFRLIGEEAGEPVQNIDIPRLAERINLPALVIHDERDDEIPVEEGRAIAAAWKGSRWSVTSRYGHRRIILAKEVVKEVTDFLGDSTFAPAAH